MNKIEIAKAIYIEILEAIQKLENDHDIYCAIPRFIELDGVIYLDYQCLEEAAWDKKSERVTQQMRNIIDDKVKFYVDKNSQNKIKTEFEKTT